MIGVLGCVLGMGACSSGVQADPAVISTGKTVYLAPIIEVGAVGWCVGEPAGNECSEERARSPIIAQGWSGSGPPQVTEGYALTTSDVASVLVDGIRVPTRREAALPSGLRAVSVEIRGSRLLTESHGKPHYLVQPRFVPLDADGRPLQERRGSLRLAVFELATRSIASAGGPSSESCRIDEGRPLKGLEVQQARTLVRIRAYADLFGGGLMPCVNASYRIEGSAVLAAILLDAADPGRTPGSLPGMQPVRGRPGMFQAVASTGEIVAQRIAGGWLVVGGGRRMSERVMVLEHLNATV
jgi:hypothetical protein